MRYVISFRSTAPATKLLPERTFPSQRASPKPWMSPYSMRYMLVYTPSGDNSMQTWFWEWFGEDSHLSALQMSCRAAACFFLVLTMIRLSGRRSFGQHTPFDACVTVLLGAVLSRAVVGASPFVETVTACFSIALLHRLAAMLSARFALIDRLMNGKPRMLVYKGGKDPKQMRRALVSDADLIQALRERANCEQLDGIEKVTLERNGNISIVREN